MVDERRVIESVDRIAKVVAVLVADGNYTYVDKLANAPSADLVLFYLREAMRDFHSLLRHGKVKNEDASKLFDRVREEIYSVAGDVNKVLDFLNESVTKVYEECRNDPKRLREICSLIGAKALAISAPYIKES
jgi:CRISPR-associated protein Csa5